MILGGSQYHFRVPLPVSLLVRVSGSGCCSGHVTVVRAVVLVLLVLVALVVVVHGSGRPVQCILSEPLFIVLISATNFNGILGTGGHGHTPQNAQQASSVPEYSGVYGGWLFSIRLQQAQRYDLNINERWDVAIPRVELHLCPKT